MNELDKPILDDLEASSFLFEYKKVEIDSYQSDRKSSLYHRLIFVLSGSFTLSDQENHYHISAGQFFFVAKKLTYTIALNQDIEVLVLYYQTFLKLYDREVEDALSALYLTATPDVPLFDTHLSIQMFITNLLLFMKDKTLTKSYFCIKKKELFELINHYYSPKDLAKLLYYAHSPQEEFRSKVLLHYKTVRHVDELAQNLNMSKTLFSRKFQEVFQTSPGKWLAQQKALQLHDRMQDPTTSIMNLMDEFGFLSATQFTRFCKRHFGAAPTQIMRKLEIE